MMRKTCLLLAAFAAAAVDASTTVSVMEFGKKGSVRRTTSTSAQTTVAGVESFWKAMSNAGLQQPGMPVVPDLFHKPSNSVVVGITGADLDSMPNLAKLVETENRNVVGQMKVSGSKSKALCKKAGQSMSTNVETMVEGVKSQIESKDLSSVHIEVDSETAAEVDAKVEEMLMFLDKYAGDSTIVVHLVVEEEEGSVRRRLTSRRLEDQQDADEEDADGDDANECGEGCSVGKYINGVWVTPFKTMNEIQYFNVVLWTSIGLIVLVMYAIWLTIEMPLMADTLLFGESVKVMGD